MPRTKFKSKEQRRKQRCQYTRRACQEETPEHREMRRGMDKAVKQVNRVEATEDDCATRHASMRAKMQKIRAQETEEARAK